jgi:pyruvate/2-oxoglutarate dehydrogenase complex dihydrolipoamide dehydrogenase (E3) component
MKTVLVERYATLGGVCLNVGCIPSKALLHIAGVMEEAQHMADCGVSFAAPSVDLDKLRAHKDKVVGKLTGGLAGMAKGRKVEVVQGRRAVSRSQPCRSDACRRRQEDRQVPESDHRCRFATDCAAVHAQ